MLRKKTRSSFVLVLAVMIALAGLSACAPKGDAFKEQLLNALDKQSQVNNYSFQGSAELTIPFSRPQSMIGSLAGTLVNGSIIWSGVVDHAQNRMELDLGVAPAGAGSPLTLPLVFAENSLYFTLSGSDGVGYALDLSEIGGESSTSAVSGLFDELLTVIVGALDADYFKKSEQGDAASRIHIALEQDALPDMLLALKEDIPGVLEKLQEAGLIGAEQAAALSETLTGEAAAEKLKSLRLNEPGGLTFTLDKDGYISAYEFALDFQWGDDATTRHSIRWTNALSDMNGNPAFSKPIPEEARSLNNLLDSLLPGLDAGGASASAGAGASE